jgi:histone H3/H4
MNKINDNNNNDDDMMMIITIAKRVTIMQKDMQLARRIRGERV